MTYQAPKQLPNHVSDPAHTPEMILAEARALRKGLRVLVRELKKQGVKLEEAEIFQE
ncbi:MAG: hypothetical protein V1778_04945 [bacterium]